jgi:1,4-dihydroxy-2-naphthoate octaprenyltransferase
MLIVWINQFQDVPADTATGKRNHVVRLAQQDRGFRYQAPFNVYRKLMLAAFASLALMAALPLLTGDAGLSSHWLWLSLLPAAALPRVFSRAREWLAAAESMEVDWQRHPYKLLPVNASTIGIHLATGLLMALAWILQATIA